MKTGKDFSVRDIEWGCLDHIPIKELLAFLAKWDLQLTRSSNGLAIVKKRNGPA